VYTFKVQARNGIGLSLFSTPLPVLAAIRPTKVDAPILTPPMADQVVVVYWNYTND
jgi:hypothetical protein